MRNTVAEAKGISATTPEEAREAARAEDVAVFPLAIPLIAGPGAFYALKLYRSVRYSWLAFAGAAALLVVFTCNHSSSGSASGLST